MITDIRRYGKSALPPDLFYEYLLNQGVQEDHIIKFELNHDIKGKKYFNYPNKYYFADISLHNARLNYR